MNAQALSLVPHAPANCVVRRPWGCYQDAARQSPSIASGG